MDRSPEYIEMCQEAKEVQQSHRSPYGYHTWSFGDYLWSPKAAEIFMVSDFEDGDFVGINPEKGNKYHFDHHEAEYGVWLPRQDQLQAILQGVEGHELILPYAMINASASAQSVAHFSTWLMWAENRGLFARSLEQAWLGYVLFKKFGKVWTGSDWQVEAKVGV